MNEIPLVFYALIVFAGLYAALQGIAMARSRKLREHEEGLKERHERMLRAFDSDPGSHQ